MTKFLFIHLALRRRYGIRTSNNLHKYMLLQKNRLTTVEVILQSAVDRVKAPVGRTSWCHRCGLTRPIALFSENKICGFCCEEMRSSGTAEWPELGSGPDVPPSIEERDEITWVECSVTSCRARYPVCNIDKLKGKPKCHFCRNKQPCPTRSCTKCGCKFIVGKSEQDERRPHWKRNHLFCQPCVSGFPSTEKKAISVGELLVVNGYQWVGVHQVMAFSTPGLTGRQAIDKFGIEAFFPENGLFKLPDKQKSLFLNGRRIYTPTQNVAEEILSWVRSGKVEKATCAICANSFPKEQMKLACGRRGCSIQIDDWCLSQHYGGNQPGLILNHGSLTCPFCRRLPIPKIMHRYGLDLIRDLARMEEEKSEWWSAWCAECHLAARVLEKTCSVEPPNLEGFRCALCRPPPNEQELMDNARSQTSEKIKPCPKCQTQTYKVDGCNHVTCHICRAHWCWKCAWVARNESSFPPNQQVYSHLAEEHGGYYDWDIFLVDPDDAEREELRRELRHFFVGGDEAFELHMEQYWERRRRLQIYGQRQLARLG